MNNLKTLLTYDTETTGFPSWKLPSGSEEQPHLVQLAAVLSNAETGETIGSIDVIIKPDGWIIPDEMTAIHGITTDYAMKVGIPERMAVELLHVFRGDAERVAYNKTFDQRIIRIAMKRYSSDAMIEKWAVKDDHHCAMRMAQKAMGGKSPKLAAAYLEICGKELINAHSAMADTLAAKEIYFKLIESQKNLVA